MVDEWQFNKMNASDGNLHEPSSLMDYGSIQKHAGQHIKWFNHHYGTFCV
jgi:hypothetical protein